VGMTRGYAPERELSSIHGSIVATPPTGRESRGLIHPRRAPQRLADCANREAV
jgi:hypothetical protein